MKEITAKEAYKIANPKGISKHTKKTFMTRIESLAKRRLTTARFEKIEFPNWQEIITWLEGLGYRCGDSEDKVYIYWDTIDENIEVYKYER